MKDSQQEEGSRRFEGPGGQRGRTASQDRRDSIVLTWLLVCLAGAGGGAFPGMAGHDPEPSPIAGQSRHTGPSLCSTLAGAVQTRPPVDPSSPSRRMRRVAVAIEAVRPCVGRRAPTRFGLTTGQGDAAPLRRHSSFSTSADCCVNVPCLLVTACTLFIRSWKRTAREKGMHVAMTRAAESRVAYEITLALSSARDQV